MDDKKKYIKKQNEWIKANEVKIGDWVNVTKIAKSYENGWDNTWLYSMECGKKQITAIHDKGIKCQNYNYPYFVLELSDTAMTDTKDKKDTTGRTNIGFAEPEEYRETAKLLKEHQERLYNTANETFEKIEAKRVHAKAQHDIENDCYMVNYDDFNIKKMLSNVPDDMVAVLVEASSGIDVYIRCSFANRFNKADAYMCGYKLLHANWGSKHDNKWRHEKLSNCIVAIKRHIRAAKASLKVQPDIKVEVL